MGLFKPPYETDNPNKIDKAIASLSKVSSEQDLALIYKNAPLDEVADAALARIKSQQVLRDLLRINCWRRQADIPGILARIDDVSLLKDILKEGREKSVMHPAQEKYVVDAFAKIPDPDPEEIMLILPIVDVDKAVGMVEQLEYPKDRELLRDIMMNFKLEDPIVEAAAKKSRLLRNRS